MVAENDSEAETGTAIFRILASMAINATDGRHRKGTAHES